MYKVLKNGQVIANTDFPTLNTKIKTAAISAMVKWLELHNGTDFGLYDIYDPWPNQSGKRSALFEAEDNVMYEFIEQ